MTYQILYYHLGERKNRAIIQIESGYISYTNHSRMSLGFSPTLRGAKEKINQYYKMEKHIVRNEFYKVKDLAPYTGLTPKQLRKKLRKKLKKNNRGHWKLNTHEHGDLIEELKGLRF